MSVHTFLIILMLSFNLLPPFDSMSALMKIIQIFTYAAVRKSDAFGIFLISVTFLWVTIF